MMLSLEIKSLFVRCHRILRKQQTVRAEDIPSLYREPGVLTGYRLPGQPLLSYIFSAFQLNNETVNIWTHVVGFLVILCRTIFLVEEFGADDRRISPLIGFGVSCMIYTSLSVIAHTIHSASPAIHYTCFQADYAGIGIYVFSSAFPFFYLSADSHTRESLSGWFLPVNFFFSWLCFFCCCVAKLRYRRPYPFRRKLWQVIPLGTHMIMTMSLLHRRVFKCYLHYDVCDDPALRTYKEALILSLISGMTFSSHLPEKLWPGSFDLIGQGHQVFHVVTIFVNLAQISAAQEDIMQASKDVQPDMKEIPSLSFLLLVIMCWAMCSVLTIIGLRPYVLRRVQADEEREKHRN